MGKQSAAVAATLDEMRDSGQLADVPVVLVAMVEGLAEAIDTGVLIDGKRSDATPPLWREYRSALAALIEAGAGGDTDDDTAEFLLSIRTPVRAPMGDAPKP